jgi:RNA recognition motif-containing protein
MNNIFVGNLSPEATERDIRSIFEKHGTVERFRLMTDRETGQPRGFAFVEMTHDTAAEKAIAALNGAQLNGRSIHVNAARPQLYRNSGDGSSRSKTDSGEARTINDQNGSLPIQS